MTSTADLVADSVADLDKKLPEPKTFKMMSTKERINYIKEVITVEPIIAAYVLASTICQPALYYLEFEKACRSNLELNDTICDAVLADDNDTYKEINGQLQDVIGKMHSWQGPLQSIMPLILILFLGSYSDRHQLRKPFMIIPIFGEFFAVAGCILCVVFMRQWPLEVQGVVQQVLPSFFGGQPMIVMAIFAYIADVSTLEMRTLRIGAVQIVLNICTPIAQAVAGKLFNLIGYHGVLSIAVVCYLFAVLYAFFRIKEPKKPKVDAKKSLLTDIFDLKHAVETFNLLLKKSKGNNRMMIAVIMLILFVYSLVSAGEYNVVYLYLQNVFKWGPEPFSYFLTANTVVHLLGTLIALPLFTTCLKMGDLAILIVTFIDKILANIVFGVGNSVVMLYVAVVVSLVTGISAIAIRSTATKIVSPDDLGKAQSLFGICEAVAAQALAAPIYNAIYLNTKDNYPTMYFYFGIILYVLCLGIVIWMYYKMVGKKSAQEQELAVQTDSVKKIPEDFQLTHI